MNTQEQRLMWLLDFAQLKLGELKGWERLKFRTELQNFLSSEPGVTVAFDEDPQTVSDREAATLQREVYSALGMFSPITKRASYWDKVMTSREGFKFAINPNAPSSGMAFDIRIIASIFKASGLVEIRGSLKALIENSLLTLLKDTSLRSRITACPECWRMFLRMRKQVYCSRTCLNRVSRRQWLQVPKNRKKEAQWARKRYEQRVKRQKGKNVIVQRRTRTKKGSTK